MSKGKMGSAGGKARAIQQRDESRKRYLENPKICLYCKQVIPLRENIQVGETRKKKFCDHSCAAKYNNSNMQKKSSKKVKECKICGIPINCKKIHCNECWEDLKKERTISNETKSSLMSKRKNYQSARSGIRNNAKKVYNKSGKPSRCVICGYEKYVEICHIVPVSEFGENTLISVINHIDNLIALCPNHHKEYDEGILTIENIVNIDANPPPAPTSDCLIFK